MKTEEEIRMEIAVRAGWASKCINVDLMDKAQYHAAVRQVMRMDIRDSPYLSKREKEVRYAMIAVDEE